MSRALKHSPSALASANCPDCGAPMVRAAGKRKGIARVRLADGAEHRAEVHWYEAHGVGRKEMKVKRFLDD